MKEQKGLIHHLANQQQILIHTITINTSPLSYQCLPETTNIGNRKRISTELRNLPNKVILQYITIKLREIASSSWTSGLSDIQNV